MPINLEIKRNWLEAAHPGLSIREQCRLLGMNRSSLYYEPMEADALTLTLMNLIDEQYTKTPFYGSRKILIFLREAGYAINRKRVQRLMRKMGLYGICPGPNTSKRLQSHRIWPYLLGGFEIVRPNQVWSTDITYIRLAKGFLYLVAIIDWYSRYVVAWRLSNSLETSFCLETLDEALAYGRPEIFNTDQGCQFTSESFTGKLLANGIRISMDGRGRALDNVFVERLWRSVKYEDIYLKDYQTVCETQEGLKQYFKFYNTERYHQSLGYRTPAVLHFGSLN
jgi:putative transposase